MSLGRSPRLLCIVTFYHHQWWFTIIIIWSSLTPTWKSEWISCWKGFWEKLRAGGWQKSCQRRGWKLKGSSCQEVSSTRICLKRPNFWCDVMMMIGLFWRSHFMVADHQNYHQSRWNTFGIILDRHHKVLSAKFSGWLFNQRFFNPIYRSLCSQASTAPAL